MTPKPETGLDELERKSLHKIRAIAECLRKLPPDKQQQMLADIEQIIAKLRAERGLSELQEEGLGVVRETSTAACTSRTTRGLENDQQQRTPARES